MGLKKILFSFKAKNRITCHQLSQKRTVHDLKQFEESFMVAFLNFLKNTEKIQENLQNG